MVIENKTYKLDLVNGEWKCFEVFEDQCKSDFDTAKAEKRNICFTIRLFKSGTMYMLYSTCADFPVVKRQADYMSSTPGH